MSDTREVYANSQQIFVAQLREGKTRQKLTFKSDLLCLLHFRPVVMYFDQLLGAEHTRKLVETLFWGRF